MLVTLQPWEFDHAVSVASRRHTARWSSPHSSAYKAERLENDLVAEMASCVAELAVAKAANRYWHAHVWHPKDHSKYKGLPDVGTNIEVRRVRDNTHQNVAIRESQLGLGLVVFAAHTIMPDMRTVDVWGWVNQDEVWDKARVWDQDSTMRWLPRSLLTKI